MCNWFHSDGGTASQRTHPAEISDGRIPKKCLAERAGNRLAWRLAQFGGYAKHLVRGRFRIPIKWVEQAFFGSVKTGYGIAWATVLAQGCDGSVEFFRQVKQVDEGLHRSFATLYFQGVELGE